MQTLRYEYENFLEDLHKVAQMVPKDIEAIVAVARGGMTMAHMLGEFLGIRKIYLINAIGYEDTRKLQKPEIFNIPDLKEHEKILIVDDISDTGDTLLAVTRLLKKSYPSKSFYTATLFYKERSKFKPDFWAAEAKEWIEFFWSEDLKRYNNQKVC
ncbi:MAG: phosphoribosyltransferase [Hydrogenimonas sp.]|nr:phosphoribosyltransferase [Hydrogenimonas sp.]